MGTAINLPNQFEGKNFNCVIVEVSPSFPLDAAMVAAGHQPAIKNEPS